MTTAESTINALRQLAEEKSKKASVKRQHQRALQNKPARKEHHVALSQQGSSDSEGESNLSDDESIGDVMASLECLCLAATLHDEPEVVIVHGASSIHIVVNLLSQILQPQRSLANKEAAQELGLIRNKSLPHRSFHSLGNLHGYPCHPVNVQLGDRSHKVIFYVVDKPRLPLLIGKRDLARYNTFIDPVTSNLVDRVTHEIIAAGLESNTNPSDKAPPELDPITQKRLGATDDELYEDGKKVIYEKTAHLDDELT